MRKAVFNLLTTDATLLGWLPADRWYERGSVPDKPVAPFAVLAWQGVAAVGRGRTGLPRLTLWVYEPRGSYATIDNALRRATIVLEGASDYTFAGERISQADFEGSSVDLYDDIYRANARNAGYRVVGSGL